MQYGKTFDTPSPVIALTIFDQSTREKGLVCDKTRMLVTVRDPSTNITHPNVISVPTQRFPQSLFQEILGTVQVKAQQGSTIFYEGSEISSSEENSHNPVIYAVESLLSKKLELSRELESHTFAFEAILSAVKLGKSYHSNLRGEAAEECISMANIVVNVIKGGSLIPSKTQSYSYVQWVNVSRFLKTVQAKDPTVLGTGLDPIEYCIHGLCISTSYEIVRNMLHPSQLIIEPELVAE